MLTYHQVQGYLQKSVALSNDLRKLRELLLPVLQIFESIDRRNEELGVDADTLHGEIRAVQLLGEILRQHVYKQPAESRSGGVIFETGTGSDAEFTAATCQAGNWSAGPSDCII